MKRLAARFYSGKQHPHGSSFHEFDAQLHARQQELGLRPDHALFDFGLFVGLGIHEIALVSISVRVAITKEWVLRELLDNAEPPTH